MPERYSARFPTFHGVNMAKKKSRIKNVVETVESWVGMGPKAKEATKASQPKAAKKTTKKKAAAPKKGQEGGKEKEEVIFQLRDSFEAFHVRDGFGSPSACP